MKILDRYIITHFLVNFVILFVVTMMLFTMIDLIVDLDEFLKAGQQRATGELLFHLPLDLPDSSQDTPGSQDLRDAFARQGIDLMTDAVITTTQGGTHWQITSDEQVFLLVQGDHEIEVFAPPGLWRVFCAILGRIVDWYGPMIALLYNYLAGLLAVGAMAFTLTAVSRDGELVAMLTGGLSMYRIAAPLLVVGGVLNGLSLVNQEFLIPALAHKLARRKSQVEHDRVQTFAVQYAPDAEGNLISAERFNPTTGTLDHPTFLQREANGEQVMRVMARQATWDDVAYRWQLTGGYGVRRSRTDSETEPRVPRSPEPISVFPTNLSPDLLLARRAENYPSLISLAELRRLESTTGAESIRFSKIMHSRFSLVVVNVLLLTMALPFFLMRQPVNYMRQALKAATVTLSAWGLSLLLLQLNGPNPLFVAWLPVAILLPLSAGLLPLVKT